jgi:hypothetical protein
MRYPDPNCDLKKGLFVEHCSVDTIKVKTVNVFGIEETIFVLCEGCENDYTAREKGLRDLR